MSYLSISLKHIKFTTSPTCKDSFSTPPKWLFFGSFLSSVQIEDMFVNVIQHIRTIALKCEVGLNRNQNEQSKKVIYIQFD